MKRVCVGWVRGSSDPLPPKVARRTCRPPGRHRFAVLLCASALAAAMPLSAQASGPCETDDSYRALDFLLGEWRLVSGGETVGSSRVEKLADGCLIAETWSFAPRSPSTRAA